MLLIQIRPKRKSIAKTIVTPGKGSAQSKCSLAMHTPAWVRFSNLKNRFVRLKSNLRSESLLCLSARVIDRGGNVFYRSIIEYLALLLRSLDWDDTIPSQLVDMVPPPITDSQCDLQSSQRDIDPGFIVRCLSYVRILTFWCSINLYGMLRRAFRQESWVTLRYLITALFIPIVGWFRCQIFLTQDWQSVE